MNMQKKQIDWSLAESVAAGDLALATTLLQMLIQELPCHQRLLQTLYQEENWGDLEEQLHKLHGGSCYCGVPWLKEYSHQLEQIVSAGDHADIEPALAKLNACITALLEEAKQDPKLQSSTHQNHKS